MPNNLGHYSFLPWLRQGLAGDIQETDHLGVTQGGTGEVERAKVAVSIKLNDSHNVGKTFAIHGPGDVVGINPISIVKTEPQVGIKNFEANFLPYIEFYEEDFPWRYTPAKSDATNRLRPWMTLIICKDSEIEFQENPGGPLPFITIKTAAFADVLPDHRQLWAFAHVHVNQAIDDAANFETDLEAALAANPDIAVSRLLCARKLEPDTDYQAFLIPSFETGRLAGLGEDTKTVVAQQSAWDTTNPNAQSIKPLTFPIYYRWSFATSSAGDFEALVTKLKTVPAGPNLGKRDMSIEAMGYGIEAGDSKTVGLEGALRPPNFNPIPWPNPTSPTDQAAKDKLKDVLNLSKDLKTGSATGNNPFYTVPISDDPIITPPIYGQHHAAITEIGALNNPEWIKSLNLDPRNRAVAGLGAKVIQEKQEDFMEQAWQQIGTVNEANQKIREAQLAKQVNKTIFNKHVDNGDQDRMIMVTSQLHKRLMGSGKTVHAAIKESKVPLAAKSPSFKRIVRPGKKSNKRFNKQAITTARLHEQVMVNFDKNLADAGVITAAPPKSIPIPTISAITLDAAVNTAITSLSTDPKKRTIFNLPPIVKTKIANLTGTVVSDKTTLINAINASAEPADVKQNMTQIVNAIITVNLSNSDPLVDVELLVNQTIYETFYNSLTTGRVAEGIVIKRPLTAQEITNGKTENIVPGPSIADQQLFQADLADFNTFVGNISQTAAPAPLQAVSIATQIKTNLDLEQATALRVQHKIKVYSAAQGGFVPLPQLKPIMAHPKFDEPVYQNLSALSQDYILPNLGDVPSNSLTLLETNNEFIEAYMAGLNHEMARELLWREYPTDQRGSYFRQFWDIKDSKNATPEDGYTVKKMHEWTGSLGSHAHSTASYLVLLVRGELLQKFPNTLIYAQRAQWGTDASGLIDKNKARVLKENPTDADLLFPVLRGKLDPDITFFGFDMTDADARGNRIKNPGWFFVFKERPGEIRFGLDDFIPTGSGANTPSIPPSDATDWNDLSWGHTVNVGGNLNGIKHLDVTSTIRANVSGSTVTWGANSADMAHILFQNPVIFARHAGEML